jgi:predicted Zn-dependent protease
MGLGKGEDSKAKAVSLIAEAKELYGQVAQSSPALEPLARVGLALATIQEGDLDKGRAALEEVTKKWPQSIGAEKARVNIEALAGYKPAQFSNEALDEPKPEANPEEGKAPAKEPAAKTDSKPAEAPKGAGEKAPTPKG